MEQKIFTTSSKVRRCGAYEDDWMSPAEFARAYNVSRSTAYEAFHRLSTVHIGGCIRARRSEIEERLKKYGRI